MKQPKSQADKDKVDILPDAWEKFERAVNVVIKSGPKHRQQPLAKLKERPPSKGRVHKGRSRT